MTAKAILPEGYGYHAGQDFNRATVDHPVEILEYRGPHAIFRFLDGFKPTYNVGGFDTFYCNASNLRTEA